MLDLLGPTVEFMVAGRLALLPGGVGVSHPAATTSRMTR